MTRPLRTVLPPDALDSTDRAILNALQDGFPLTPRPYDDAGADLGVTGDDLIVRLARLRDLGAITRFGPFSTRRKWAGPSAFVRWQSPATVSTPS